MGVELARIGDLRFQPAASTSGPSRSAAFFVRTSRSFSRADWSARRAPHGARRARRFPPQRRVWRVPCRSPRWVSSTDWPFGCRHARFHLSPTRRIAKPLHRSGRPSAASATPGRPALAAPRPLAQAPAPARYPTKPGGAESQAGGPVSARVRIGDSQLTRRCRHSNQPRRRATCCKVRQRTVTPPGRPMPGSIPGSPTILPRINSLEAAFSRCDAQVRHTACILQLIWAPCVTAFSTSDEIRRQGRPARR